MKVLLFHGQVGDPTALADAYGHGGYILQRINSLMDMLAHLPTAAILVIYAPILAGIEVMRLAHSRDPHIPVALVYDGLDTAQRISALEAGADECFDAGVDPREARARVQLVLRRCGYQEEVRCGDILIRPFERELQIAGTRVHVPKRELSLLLTLASSPKRVWSRRELLERIWGPVNARDDRLVDVCVHHLRRTLRTVQANPVNIRSVRGKGYALQL
ncbi:DNA-binding response OmpR family regulator [Deinobacterium chartae]|uniref:DNA-binding response OmpR family regulator n=1 Tax=Deinobacterium chartae TaxID=521158 RepID=A0A841HYC3_9DEIO|nr:response regulator transcription factor [Deinobacterium chartae]MBB6097883.1 DNA-binding response OmpR family regulator [Deinobacterium chartae]